MFKGVDLLSGHSGYGKTVELRLGTVGAGGNHSGALGTKEQASGAGTGKQGDGLVEDITSFDVGHDEHVAVALQG